MILFNRLRIRITDHGSQTCGLQDGHGIRGDSRSPLLPPNAQATLAVHGTQVVVVEEEADTGTRGETESGSGDGIKGRAYLVMG